MEMNNQTPFERCLNQVSRTLIKVNVALEDVQTHILRGDIKGAFEAAFDLEDQSEKLTLLTRELPAYTGHPKAKEILEDVMLKTFPIRIGFTEDGWFCVMIPALLPKKEKGSADYIGDLLYLAMVRYWRDKQPVRYTDCVLVFRHVYDRERPERNFRDHDNIELNKITDIIALFVMPDDAPMQCRHYYCSARGSENRTEVYVVPNCEFTQWVVLESIISEQGVKLYENMAEIPAEN